MTKQQEENTTKKTNLSQELTGSSASTIPIYEEVLAPSRRLRVSIRKIPDPGLASRVISITGCT